MRRSTKRVLAIRHFYENIRFYMTNILQNNDTQIRMFIIKEVEAEIYSPYVAISGEGITKTLSTKLDESVNIERDMENLLSCFFVLCFFF